MIVSDAGYHGLNRRALTFQSRYMPTTCDSSGSVPWPRPPRPLRPRQSCLCVAAVHGVATVSIGERPLARYHSPSLSRTSPGGTRDLHEDRLATRIELSCTSPSHFHSHTHHCEPARSPIAALPPPHPPRHHLGNLGISPCICQVGRPFHVPISSSPSSCLLINPAHAISSLTSSVTPPGISSCAASSSSSVALAFPLPLTLVKVGSLTGIVSSPRLSARR